MRRRDLLCSSLYIQQQRGYWLRLSYLPVLVQCNVSCDTCVVWDQIAAFEPLYLCRKDKYSAMRTHNLDSTHSIVTRVDQRQPCREWNSAFW